MNVRNPLLIALCVLAYSHGTFTAEAQKTIKKQQETTKLVKTSATLLGLVAQVTQLPQLDPATNDSRDTTSQSTQPPSDNVLPIEAPSQLEELQQGESDTFLPADHLSSHSKPSHNATITVQTPWTYSPLINTQVKPDSSSSKKKARNRRIKKKRKPKIKRYDKSWTESQKERSRRMRYYMKRSLPTAWTTQFVDGCEEVVFSDSGLDTDSSSDSDT